MRNVVGKVCFAAALTALVVSGAAPGFATQPKSLATWLQSQPQVRCFPWFAGLIAGNGSADIEIPDRLKNHAAYGDEIKQYEAIQSGTLEVSGGAETRSSLWVVYDPTHNAAAFDHEQFEGAEGFLLAPVSKPPQPVIDRNVAGYRTLRFGLHIGSPMADVYRVFGKPKVIAEKCGYVAVAYESTPAHGGCLDQDDFIFKNGRVVAMKHRGAC